MCIVPHCSALYGRTRSDAFFEARGSHSTALEDNKHKRLIISSDHIFPKPGYYRFENSAKLYIFRFWLHRTWDRRQ